MSLHTLASNLQHAGRGDDKVLVHMTPGEVGGLQKLAQAHGGSLTINPETGLPEAGFLSSLLPTLIGAGLSIASGGALTPLMAAGITGAGYGLATGSLSKGLMAGLGAYGGAGMGASLTAAGTPVAATTPSALAGNTPFGTTMGAGVEKFGMGTTQFEVANKAAQAGALPSFTGYSPSAVMPKLATQPAAMAQTAAAASPGSYFDTRLAANNLANPASASLANPAPNYAFRAEVAQAPVGTLDIRNTAAQVQRPMIDASQYPRAERFVQTPEQIAFSQRPAPELSGFEKAKAGLKNVTSSGKNAWEFVKENPMPFITTGLAAAKELQPKYEEPKKQKSFIRPYDYSYNATGADVEPYSGSGERLYFSPTYTAQTPYEAPGPEYAAEGGLMGIKYAIGGPVEQMSADNAIGANQNYPQSQLQTAMYSNPMVQRPQTSNVITSGIDANVNPYTGEAKFAKGGETTGGYKYDYDPRNQQFTQISTPKPVDTGVIGLATRAFTGMYGQPQQTGGNGFSGMLNKVASKPKQAAPEAPIVTGGITPPAYQPQQMESYQPLQQPTNIPAYQSPEQQLGLGGFYDYMNQQLAEQGGYAKGGSTRSAPLNSKMASVDSAAQLMKTQEGLQQTIKAARDGDYSAMLALKNAGYDMNELNEYANGGGVSTLGDYSDGGRLLKGPGDGVSDSIPASIGNRQPARLADGEFVIPARIVSELGNGSTEAGARQLYAMMDRVQKARGKTTGKGRVAVNSRANKHLPA